MTLDATVCNATNTQSVEDSHFFNRCVNHIHFDLTLTSTDLTKLQRWNDYMGKLLSLVPLVKYRLGQQDAHRIGWLVSGRVGTFLSSFGPC